MTWLTGLERELQSRRCATRSGGVHDPWDLSVAAGPMVSAQITTAVQWSWQPASRVRYRLRAGAAAVSILLLVGAGVAFGALGVLVAAAVLCLFGLGELLRLRARIRAALLASTAGARVGSGL